MEPARRVWLLGCSLLVSGVLLWSSSSALPNHPKKLVCWQAIMNCQGEPECNYAYDHYIRACGPVLTGKRKKCPSHCIASLVQLNQTRNGPALEDCGCGSDPACKGTKRAIEPCLPRTTSTGCTEARRQCERDQQCSASMHDYLHHCGKLFGGVVCTGACRNVIASLRRIPKGQQLDTCMCDGAERAICEFVKSSMNALCFDAPGGREESSGSHEGPDQDQDDEDYALETYERDVPENGGPGGPHFVLTLLLASILTAVALT